MTKKDKAVPDGIKASLDALTGIEEIHADMQKKSIEDATEALEKGLKKLKAKAETAEEFKEKYGRKHFNASTAGKAHILAYVYWAYLKNEGMSTEELLANPLYKNLSSYSKKLQTLEDLNTYNAYIRLEEWVGSSIETALYMRNATKSVIAHFYSIAQGAIAGEELRNALGAQADEDEIALWLSALSVDNIRPTTATYNTVLVLRKNIDKGLRYINVYNTLITMIADAIEIPEFDVFLLDMEPIREMTSYLNEALELLREAVRKRETVPNEQALTTAPPRFTERALEATLEAFRDVTPEAPPIPEDDIAYADLDLRAAVLKGRRSWSHLFTILKRNY